STAQATHTTPSPQCDLQGQWRNELGSNMTILAMNRAGTFLGSCHTAVAATNKQILVSALRGVQ
ncbi:AVID protein, partial [Agelaius phoeniceus]|nr:AVID protein [Agelaius phoeniceus]